MRVGTARITAALLPAALFLHQGTYLLLGEGAPAAHGYLHLLLPVAVACSAGLAIASILAPLIAAPAQRERQPLLTPFALASALVAIFVVQEAAEVLLLGGGAVAAAAAAAALSVVVPGALLLGVLAATLIESLGRAESLLARLIAEPAAAGRWALVVLRRPAQLRRSMVSPLAFGIACRPPPAQPLPS